MKRLLLFLFLILGLGCIHQVPWTFHVIDDGVTEYALDSMASKDISTIEETLVEKEIKKVTWEGVLAREFGEGDTINFISQDGYLVSIPYNVDVILAFRKEGNPIGEEDGGPLKIIVDPTYGCKCNWLKYLRIVEFVDKEDSFSVYGDVFNLLTFSPRDLNLHYGLEDVLANTSNEVPLVFVLDKAITKENATTITFVTEDGRYTYTLQEIRDMNPTLIYDNGFCIIELGIVNLKGIKIE
ncbi:MAG: molybdopterin-dependent oxidoreductase [Theionarchaea archaeon]|nr:molybdopterin-dependent oxidoreductase [Theionarchaea archaeon]